MKKRLFTTICLALFLTLYFFAQAKKNRDHEGYNSKLINDYLYSMDNSYSQKRYTEVIKFASKVLNIDSTNVLAHSYCAIAYRNINLYPQALTHFDKAVEFSQSNPKMYNNRGALNNELGYDSIAFLDFNEAIELDYMYAYPYNNRGIYYTIIQQYDKALEDLNMAIELKPQFPYPYMNRGEVYFELGEFEKALDDYNMALEYKIPEIGNALYDRGLVFIKLRRMQDAKEAFEQAIEAYTQALKENIYDYESILNRAKVYEQLDNYELALPDYKLALEKYQEMVEQNPKSPVMIYRRASAYKGLKEYDNALADLDQVLQLRPWDKQAEMDRQEIKEIIANSLFE